MESSMTRAEKEAKARQYKENILKEAETLVLDKFPDRIIELEELSKDCLFTVSDLSEVHSDINIPIPSATRAAAIMANADCDGSDAERAAKKRKLEAEGGNHFICSGDVSGTKVLILPGGVVPTNKYVVKVTDILKPLIWQLVNDTNLLKMWVQFLIPKVEDGNNFGVAIQEEVLTEIRTVETEAATYFEQISRYFMSRAKIVAKVGKYPHVDDFRRTINEVDEKQYVSLRLTLNELKNHYSTLHDLIMKNFEKIKKPRNSHAEHLY